MLKNPLCSKNTVKDFEVEATRWFGNAKDRCGGRERRRKHKSEAQVRNQQGE